jgi:arylsulfatase A-like enzyme
MRTCDTSEASLPLGLLLCTLSASISARCVLLWPHAHVWLLCGLPQDLKGALLVTLPCVALPRRAAQVASVLATLMLAADLCLRLGSGARAHISVIAFVLGELFDRSGDRAGTHAIVLSWPQRAWLMVKNLSMAPPAAVYTLIALLPASGLVWLAARVRAPLSRARWLALLAALGGAAVLDPPCCRGSVSSCPSIVDDAQSLNAVVVLMDDVWQQSLRANAADAAAMKRGEVLARQAADLSSGPQAPMAAMQPRRRPSRTAARGATSRQNASSTATGHRRHKRRNANEAAGNPTSTSRNVVLVTLESVSAIYMDPYDTRARAMPFLRSLFASAKEGEAVRIDRYYATEPNTIHSMFATMCGVRPWLGVRRAEYEDRARLAKCVPALLRAAGIHTAFIATSSLGYQHDLGFEQLLSTTKTYNRTSPFKEVRWPKANWWKADSRSLAPDGMYNWLGHHDVFNLPQLRDYIESRGSSRFFLQTSTLGTHAPFTAANCPLFRGHAQLRPDMPKAPEGKLARANWDRYLKELQCADRFIQEVHGILQRAGRLHDTTLIVTADHGEGFQMAHSADIVHGGVVYDTQSRIPFLAFGPLARGMPKEVGGVWSDTSLAPSLLEAFGAPLPAGMARVAAEAEAANLGRRLAAPASNAASFPSPTLGLGDVYCLSIWSHWRVPPRQAYMSCAFDKTCAGVVMTTSRNTTKYVWQVPGDTLEVYDLARDPYEEHNVASRLPREAREAVLAQIRAWSHAVSELHPKQSASTSPCPLEVPFAYRKWSPIHTHCCAAPEVQMRDGMFATVKIGRCPKGYRSIECASPPCVDHEDAPKIRKRVELEYRQRVAKMQQEKQQRERRAQHQLEYRRRATKMQQEKQQRERRAQHPHRITINMNEATSKITRS